MARPILQSPAGNHMRVAVLALSLLTAGCAAAAPTRSGSPAPAVDHHQHLLSPAGAELVNRVLPAVALPRGVARLLAERVARWRDPRALRDLYTADAIALGPESPGWLRGGDAAAELLGSVFARPFTLLPVAYQRDGGGANVAAYFMRDDGSRTRPIGYLFLALRMEAGGAWKIAAETPIFPGPRQESVVDADQLVAMLDAAGIGRAVVLSDAYYFDSPRIAGAPGTAAAVRAENDWTAEQVARHPGRLLAFCSVNPLADYAPAEVERCGNTGRYRGLKLHFHASAVDLLNREHAEKVRKVIATANRARLALIIHARGGGEYGRDHALALLDVLRAAPDVPVQIAHLWGGERFAEGALGVYADAVAAGHPGAQKLYFDVAQIAGNADADLERAVSLVRRIGVGRILYGSDGPQFGGAPPGESWSRFRERVPLTEEEFRIIAGNVAPYLRGP
jgi:predicted TIM-barrel fold metal-dependent hydrolase